MLQVLKLYAEVEAGESFFEEVFDVVVRGLQQVTQAFGIGKVRFYQLLQEI